MQKVIIRQSPGKLISMAIVSAVFILIYFFAPFSEEENNYKNNTFFYVLIGLILLTIFLYSIIELLIRKGEIILEEDGIEIRRKGWNQWDYVNACWTVLERDSENSDKEYLILQLKDLTNLKCMISDLDKSREEIIDLIRHYKKDIIYNGQLVE